VTMKKSFITLVPGLTDAEVPDTYNDWRNRDFPTNYKTKFVVNDPIGCMAPTDKCSALYHKHNTIMLVSSVSDALN
jgi:hypothetical protein